MAITAELHIYGNMLKKAFAKEIDWENDDIKCMLLDSNYVPNVDTDIYLNDVIANEITGTGYTAGGQTLTNCTLTYDSANNKVIIDSDNPIWENSTITARYAVIYNNTPATDSEKALICYFEFINDGTPVDVSSNSAIFEIVINANGIMDFDI